jgi:hypothetical protein
MGLREGRIGGVQASAIGRWELQTVTEWCREAPWQEMSALGRQLPVAIIVRLRPEADIAA